MKNSPVLSILVPVFNESEHLESVVKYLCESECPIARQWIFIDDCSTDASHSILRRLQSHYGYEILGQTRNCGKGAAIRAGLERVTGDYVMIQDADFEYDPRDVPRLLAPLIGGKADVVYGSRFVDVEYRAYRPHHYFANRFLTSLSNALSGLTLTDMETCYKIFRADLVKAMRLESNRFGVEVELTALVSKTAARVVELPISYRPRTYLQGKKITWKDGVAAVFHLFYFNWGVSFARAFESLPLAYSPADSAYLISRSIAIASAQRFTPN